MTRPLLPDAALALRRATRPAEPVTGTLTGPVTGPVTGAVELSVEGSSVGELTVGEGQRLAGLVTRARSAATTRAYTSDLTHWNAWCARRGTDPARLDPALVALHLQEAAAALTPDGEPAYAPATLTRWVSSLNHHARTSGQPAPGEHPLVAAVLAAVRRTRTHTPRRRDPLLPEDLTRLLTHIRAGATTRAERVAAARDTALFLVGFYGAFRRSELAALQLRDAVWHPTDGLHIHLRRSKTDPDATGSLKPLPPHQDPALCPVCAVLAWTPLVTAWDTAGRPGLIRAVHLTTTPPEAPGHHRAARHGGLRCPQHHPDTPTPAADPATPSPVVPSETAARPVAASARPLFRSLHPTGVIRGPLTGHAVNDMIRRRATAAGLDPDRLPALGGHSLRAGFVTAAYRAGATAEEIARQTGHASLTVLASYQRERDPLRGNAVTHLTHTTPPTPAAPDHAPPGPVPADPGAPDPGPAT